MQPRTRDQKAILSFFISFLHARALGCSVLFCLRNRVLVQVLHVQFITRSLNSTGLGMYFSTPPPSPPPLMTFLRLFSHAVDVVLTFIAAGGGRGDEIHPDTYALPGTFIFCLHFLFIILYNNEWCKAAQVWVAHDALALWVISFVG